ncbi:MAG: hypothetical protein KJ906_03745 [Nanoarchaeota archaeon]|nr:hypothetical protein [Nanoarchaeota archaeon]
MNVNRRSNDYLKTEKTSGVYETNDGVECIRELYISGSDERIKSEASWLKGRLMP